MSFPVGSDQYLAATLIARSFLSFGDSSFLLSTYVSLKKPKQELQVMKCTIILKVNPSFDRITIFLLSCKEWSVGFQIDAHLPMVLIWKNEKFSLFTGYQFPDSLVNWGIEMLHLKVIGDTCLKKSWSEYGKRVIKNYGMWSMKNMKMIMT